MTIGFVSPVLLHLIILQLAHYQPTTGSWSTSTTNLRSHRIADGRTTSQGEYPAVLSLGLTSWANVYHLHHCAGTIITETWVLTAARCVEDGVDDVGRYYWLAGTHNLRQGGTRYAISRILIHPGYNPYDSLIHDIALVRVGNPFEFSSTIQPFAVSTTAQTSTVGIRGVVVGWGQVSQTLIQPDVLRSANVTIIDVDACREIYAPWSLNIREEYQFCALASVDEADGRISRLAANAEEGRTRSLNREACQGDEGGAFFSMDANPSLVLGLVSLTYGCNPSGYPTVYSKISPYFDWIRANTGY